MWDAKKNYWADHEWNSASPWQPTLLTQPANPNYAKSSTDPRYWNTSYPGEGISNPATQSCAALPNANEMSWYYMFGNPLLDKDELWTTMGHLYKGGIWLKKKSVLQAEKHYNTEKSAVDKTDLRTTGKDYSKYLRIDLPSAADAGNYFYLPALGDYDGGKLKNIGDFGFYASSSANPLNYSHAYAFYFSVRNQVGVSVWPRFYGFRAEAFQ